MSDDSAPPAEAAPDATPPATPPQGGGGDAPKPDANPGMGGQDTPSAAPSDPKEPTFTLPDEYKDKPWAAKIKNEGDLWKQLENAQALIGKKTVVPDLAKATPEEREAYYANFRPENVEVYGLADVSPDVILPSVRDALGKGLFENGVSPVQAKPILEAVAAASLKEKEVAFSAENFTAEAEKVMGKGYDPKPLQATLKSTLSADTYKSLMEKIPNQNLVQIHKAMKEIVDAYGIKQSGAHVDAQPGTQQITDIAAYRKQLRDDIAALSKRPHEAAEKQALINKLNATYENQVKQGA